MSVQFPARRSNEHISIHILYDAARFTSHQSHFQILSFGCIRSGHYYCLTNNQDLDSHRYQEKPLEIFGVSVDERDTWVSSPYFPTKMCNSNVTRKNPFQFWRLWCTTHRSWSTLISVTVVSVTAQLKNWDEYVRITKITIRSSSKVRTYHSSPREYTRSFLSPQVSCSLERVEHSAIKIRQVTWIFKIDETEIGMLCVKDIIEK